jgi:hypothetical protein
MGKNIKCPRLGNKWGEQLMRFLSEGVLWTKINFQFFKMNFSE